MFVLAKSVTIHKYNMQRRIKEHGDLHGSHHASNFLFIFFLFLFFCKYDNSIKKASWLAAIKNRDYSVNKAEHKSHIQVFGLFWISYTR